MSDKLREEHDRLLAEKPESAVHDEENCIYCNGNDDSNEGGDMKTYTEEEFNKAVADAVAPVKAELESLKSTLAEGEVEDRVAEAKAEADAKMAEAQAELDKAEAAKSVAEKALADTLAYLEQIEEDRKAEAALEELRGSRRAAIEELALYDAEFIDSKLDFWTSLSEDDFAALVESIKVTAEAAAEKARKSTEETDESGDDGSDVLDSTRNDTAGAESKDDLGSVLGARTAGVDIRTLY